MTIAFAIAQFSFALLDKLPALIAAGVSVENLIQRHKQLVTEMAQSNRAPTDSEWNLLNEELTALENQLQSAHKDAAAPNSGA